MPLMTWREPAWKKEPSRMPVDAAYVTGGLIEICRYRLHTSNDAASGNTRGQLNSTSHTVGGFFPSAVCVSQGCELRWEMEEKSMK